MAVEKRCPVKRGLSAVFCPWPSAHNVLMILTAVFLLSLINLTASEWASWVQAIGSILAIIYAVNIANSQYRRSEQLRKDQDAVQYQNLVGFVGFVMGGMSTMVNYLEDEKMGMEDLARHIEILEDLAATIKSVGLDGIRHVELSGNWACLRMVVSDFISAAKKGEDIEDVRTNFLPHMKRSFERAKACQEEMLAPDEPI